MGEHILGDVETYKALARGSRYLKVNWYRQTCSCGAIFASQWRGNATRGADEHIWAATGSWPEVTHSLEVITSKDFARVVCECGWRGPWHASWQSAKLRQDMGAHDWQTGLVARRKAEQARSEK